jgi:hypothetical protein
MRKHASGVQIGAYVVGGLVSLYLIFGVSFIVWTDPMYRMLPKPAFIVLSVAFVPIAQAFEAFGYFDEIRRQ